MARNGSGKYSRVSGVPYVYNTVIDQVVVNAEMDDIATALTASLAKDGQTTPTANLPMGTFRHTGVGAAAARTDYARAAEVQDGAITKIASVAGTNTITASAPISMAAYAVGQEFTFIPAATNTGAATLNINSIGAGAVQQGGKALVGGELKISVPVRVLVTAATPVFEIIGSGALFGPHARADIASATTLDLDATLTHSLNVTGTTPTTGMTLADGAYRILRANAAWPITHGASLICPGSASYTCAAGDLIIAIGEPAGVVRLVIWKADGTAVVTTAVLNYIINGGMQVIQRGAVALSATANTTYCADRITVQAAGGTGLAGNGANATSGGNTRSGYMAGAMACDWTNATMKVQTRLEDVSVIALNGKTVTVSGKLYHDLGSARTCQVVVQKANSANNFSATTTLGTSATFQAASGAYTSFSYTLALGGSDATNGLLISVEDTAASTATGKTFAVGDLQLEEGAAATPFEVRPYGFELALSQRYYEKSYDIGTAPGTSTTNGICSMNASTVSNGYRYAGVRHKVEKRTAPTVAIYSQIGTAGQSSNGAGTDLSANGAQVFDATTSGFNLANNRGSDINPVGNVVLWHYTSSAEL